MPRNRSKIQEALRQRKQNESAAILNQAQAEEAAYQCFFQRDAVPSPIESGVTCLLKLAKLSVFPNHEEYFPLYTGERLADMVESIRRYGVQTPILVWKTAQGKYIIISGHNRVNASIIAGLDTIPAVVRTDLTKENAEDLFFEMNFRQRSLADMVFSQRVLCVAAHYNLVKHQGRRTDLLAKEDRAGGELPHIGQLSGAINEIPAGHIVVLQAKMLLSDLERLIDALTDSHRRHHNDKLGEAVFAVQFKNGLGVDIGLAGAGLHLNAKLHIPSDIGQGQAIPLLDSVHIGGQCFLVDVEGVALTQFI